MTHWLVMNVWPTALRTIVSAVTGAIVAVMIVAPAKGAVRALRHRLGSVLDSLDPDVPVGLTRQLDEISQRLDVVHKNLEGTLTVRHVEAKDAAPRH